MGATKLRPTWLAESKNVNSAGSSGEHGISMTLCVSLTGPVCSRRHPELNPKAGQARQRPYPPISSSCLMQSTSVFNSVSSVMRAVLTQARTISLCIASSFSLHVQSARE
eukprot:2322451-Pyramimonas_sp.AAC.1